MSNRNQKILKRLIKEDKINKNQLKKEFNLTSRQIAYSINTLNNALQGKSLPSIISKKGEYIVSHNLNKFISSLQEISDVVFEPKDRQNILLILLLASTESIFLNHIKIYLHISKNTALSDIKKLKNSLLTYNIKIYFSRKTGYVVVGDEWAIRSQLLLAITDIYMSFGANLTTSLLKPWQSYLTTVRSKIMDVETHLDLKYTDEDFCLMTYFISLILARLTNQNYLNNSHFQDRKEIKETREYKALFCIQDNFFTLPENEKLYISLFFLSASTCNKRNLNDTLLTNQLLNALWEFLIEFETKAFIVLPNKKELLIKLINHFIPSYYRIKYQIPIANTLYNKVRNKYEILYSFVKKSIEPLEHFFNTAIPDVEVSYITLFIGSHLISNKNKPNIVGRKIIRAVILCPNGVSMSRILDKTLRKTFPEFIFYPPTSIRNYQGFLLPHDLVFSTIPIESHKRVYVINGILSSQDQLKIRQKVLRDVYKVSFDGVQPQDILNVIKQYVTVPNENKLLNALSNKLLDVEVEEDHASFATAEVSTPGLLQLINKETINIMDNGEWPNLLNRSVDLLISKKLINEPYRKIVQHEYSNEPPYIMLNSNIVLPHINPDMVKQSLGVALLIVKNGFIYCRQRVHILTLLTTPDRVSHFNALYDIANLAKNDEFVRAVSMLNTPDEVYKTISAFIRS